MQASFLLRSLSWFKSKATVEFLRPTLLARYILSFWFKSKDGIAHCIKVSFPHFIPPLLFLSETRVEIGWLASFPPCNTCSRFRLLNRDALCRELCFPILSFPLDFVSGIEGNLRTVVPILLQKSSSFLVWLAKFSGCSICCSCDEFKLSVFSSHLYLRLKNLQITR